MTHVRFGRLVARAVESRNIAHSSIAHPWLVLDGRLALLGARHVGVVHRFLAFHVVAVLGDGWIDA